MTDDIEAAVQAAMQMHKTGCDIAQQHDRGTEYDVCIRCEKHREAVGQAIRHACAVARRDGSPLRLVREFHETFGIPIRDAPATIGPRGTLRIALIDEEFREYQDALAANDIVGIADALADLLYVVYGAALEHGIPIDAVLSEVHRSNMTKCDENGRPYMREDGKIVKGPRFSPPAIAQLLAEAEEAVRRAGNVTTDEK